MTANVIAADVPRGVPKAPWPENFGNHRARVKVTVKADAVLVRIPWRRRDMQPERKDVIVIDAASNKRVEDVLPLNINREYSELLFRPITAPGEYFVYYMPCKYEGNWWSPRTTYLPPTPPRDAEWLKRAEETAKSLAAGKAESIGRAEVLEIQAINDFHRFDPMEVIATADERSRLETGFRSRPYFCFPRTGVIRFA